MQTTPWMRSSFRLTPPGNACSDLGEHGRRAEGSEGLLLDSPRRHSTGRFVLSCEPGSRAEAHSPLEGEECASAIRYSRRVDAALRPEARTCPGPALPRFASAPLLERALGRVSEGFWKVKGGASSAYGRALRR